VVGRGLRRIVRNRPRPRLERCYTQTSRIHSPRNQGSFSVLERVSNIASRQQVEDEDDDEDDYDQRGAGLALSSDEQELSPTVYSSRLPRKSLPKIASRENQPGPKQRTISAARKNGKGAALTNLSGWPQIFRTALRSATQ